LLGGVKAPFFITQNLQSLRYICSMIILTTSTSDQTIKVIPRRTIVGGLILTIRNESTNDVTTYTGDFVWSIYDATYNLSSIEWQGSDLSSSQGETYLEITNKFDLTESNYYTFTISDSVGELYKGVIFCTDQTVDQDTNSYYTVNEGEYVSSTTFDNDYIIL